MSRRVGLCAALTALGLGLVACLGAPEAEHSSSAASRSVASSLGLPRDGILYLTFDDGPNAERTPRILDVLYAHGVRATFFVTGAKIADGEDILRRERDEGHLVANHQWEHVITPSESDFRRWVADEAAAIERVVGPMPRLFRFPNNAGTPGKRAILRELGYLDAGIGWDIGSLDWEYAPHGRTSYHEVPAELRDDFEGWVLDRAVALRGGVVLFHDTIELTAAHLDSILTRLEDLGFVFGELPRVRGVAPKNAWIGESCETADDCGFPGARCLITETMPDGVCTRSCETTCPRRAGQPEASCQELPLESPVVVDEAPAGERLCLPVAELP